MRTLKNGQSGFSLAELLVAMLILAVGLLGLAELQITAMKANSKSGAVTNALLVAQSLIEEVMAIDDDDDPNFAAYSSVFNTDTVDFTDWPVDPMRGDQLDHDGNADPVDSFGDGSRFQISFRNVLDNGNCFARVTVRVVSQTVVRYGASTVTQEFSKNRRQVDGGTCP